MNTRHVLRSMHAHTTILSQTNFTFTHRVSSTWNADVLRRFICLFIFLELSFLNFSVAVCLSIKINRLIETVKYLWFVNWLSSVFFIDCDVEISVHFFLPCHLEKIEFYLDFSPYPLDLCARTDIRTAEEKEEERITTNLNILCLCVTSCTNLSEILLFNALHLCWCTYSYRIK